MATGPKASFAQSLFNNKISHIDLNYFKNIVNN